MDGLVLQRVSKSFEAKKVLEEVSFEVGLGEIVALLGPSGCGKSTTLGLIAGLIEPDSGEIYWRGNSLRGIPPHQRHFGLMFQDLALFPHLNVFENVAFGLRLRRQPQTKVRKRVKEVLQLVNLTGFEDRDVATLSGGEMQRVALARAMAPQPQLLMLDEPLASLDRILKDRLAVELRQLLRQMNQTAIYVTHDQEEAFMVADRVILMNQGKVEQIGTPQEIFCSPSTPFVAEFLGMKNFVEGEVIYEDGESWLVTPLGRIRFPNQPAGKGIALIRPEGATVDVHEGLQLMGRVTQKLFRGDHCQIELQWGEKRFSFLLPCSQKTPNEGDTLCLSLSPRSVIFFRNHTSHSFT
ncbi:MAG: ABC transporter ATP-binding protein [Anaerolineales bacterium]|nr:ABC transporter ATP-binding protein [Anaerolineales bacterium]MDW8448048.1 ABC transporter ATP-binding protein [Anaerolineales bacterium]